jgi:uncharacterized delta-60 repeat protein
LAVAAAALTVSVAPASATQQAGQLDPGYGDGGRVLLPVGDSALAFAFALQPDDRALIAGAALVGGQEDFALARLTKEGTPDGSFGSGGIVTNPVGAGVDLISALTVAPDGRIVAAGTAQSGSGNSTFAVARYLPDGRLDPSFGNDGTVVTAFTGTAEAVAVQSDGKIVVAGGHVLLPSLQVEYGLARFDVNGDLDGSFGNGGTLTTSFPPGQSEPKALVLDRQGRIVVAGAAGQQGATTFALARYLSGGELDPTFGAGGLVTTSLGDGAAFASAVALQPNGRIVAAGRSAAGHFALARYEPDGALDRSFGDGGTVATAIGGGALAQGLAIRDGARIVAAGTATTGEHRDFALARYQPAGKLDKHFGADGVVTTPFPGYDAEIEGVAFQSDGKLVAGGRAVDARQHGQFAVARYLAR